MISVPKHLQSIIARAAQKALPGLNEPIVVTAERNKEWDYVCPSAMKFFNQFKKQGSFGFASCQDMANAILANIDDSNDAIEKIDLCQAGKGDPAKSGFFLNITLKPSFIE
jgi:protein-arginine kinase activator protein McsA